MFQRTQNQADLAFLDKLIHSEAGYSRVNVQHSSDGNYASAYDGIEDDVTIRQGRHRHCTWLL